MRLRIRTNPLSERAVKALVQSESLHRATGDGPRGVRSTPRAATPGEGGGPRLGPGHRPGGDAPLP